MKRLCSITIALIILAGVHCATPQVEFPLPESHWSFQDMAALAAAGLAPGYEYADFDGRHTFTREDMARAVAASRDFFTTSPASFSASQLALLRKLQDEFKDELERLGENRPVRPPGQSPEVPPSHWAYAAFEKFANRGLLPGVPAHRFAGGRIYTRAEMAELTARLMEQRKANPALFSDEDNRSLTYLSTEFQDELQSAAPGKPAPDHMPHKHAPWAVSGTGNLYAGVTKGNKTALTNRLTLNADSSHLESYFAGDVDNTDRTGSDVDFGRSYTFEINRKIIGYHTSKEDTQNDDYFLLGDVNNIDFDEGLLAGAVNIKGAYLSAGGPTARTTVIWGDDAAGNEISGARHMRQMAVDTHVAAMVLREYLSGREVMRSAGLNITHGPTSNRITVDYALAQGAGRGLYTSWRGNITDSVQALVEFRSYRDFMLEHNNPPRYLGRSGGNGENEKSFHVRLEWRAGSRWSYIMSRDHAFTPENGRKTNVFLAQEYRPADKWAMAWSMEKETGAGETETERGLRVRYTGFRDTTLAGSWKRGVRPSGPSSTTRFDVTSPIMNELGRLLLSFTRRKAATTRTHSYRARVSRRLSAGDSMSVSYDYTATATNKLDINYTWKY